MKRLFLVVGFLVVLFGAPALLACETCVTKDSVYRESVAPWTRCYFECQGDMSWCIPDSGTDDCDGGNPEGSCPDCDGGGDGGGGTGGGGGGCSTGPTGACPAECFSCGGTGGGGFFF